MISFNSRLKTAACSLAALTFLSGAAFAGLIVSATSSGTGINLHSKNCSVASNPGGLSGCLNNDHSQAVFLTTTNDPIKFGGDGKIEAAPSNLGFDNLKIEVVGHTFNTLILDIDATNDGWVIFKDNFGDVSKKFDLDKEGNNFFTITGADFSWISFETSETTYKKNGKKIKDGDVDDVSQIRFNGIKESGGNHNPPPAVPEPGTLSLLGMALVGLAAARRRRKSR